MRNQRSRRAPATGFTLVEVLVAIALTGIGLMALAGTTGVLLSHATSAASAVAASTRLASVVDSLRVTPCVSLAAGAVSAGGITVAWTVPNTGVVRRLSATASWGTTRPRVLLTESAVLCE